MIHKLLGLRIKNTPLVLRNLRNTIHDSQIAEISTNMSIPLVMRDDSENLNRIGENILSLLNEENQPVHVDDDLVPLEDQVYASLTLNAQFNRSSATYLCKTQQCQCTIS